VSGISKGGIFIRKYFFHDLGEFYPVSPPNLKLIFLLGNPIFSVNCCRLEVHFLCPIFIRWIS